MSNTPTPIVAVDYLNELGEGPLWHPLEHAVYWTDITGRRVFRYFPADGTHECIIQGVLVGGMTIQQDGSLLIFGEHGAISRWEAGKFSTLVEDIPTEIGSRFNDVGVDPAGRVFCGTMCTDTHPGRLYRLDVDGTLKAVLEGVGISNGIGFSPDRKILYYSESIPKIIHAFDYDRDSGELSNQRNFAVALPDDGTPDGLTVDAEGYVWSARWDGSMIVRYSPSGELVSRLAVPAKKASSCIFGGLDYRDLYVTSAGGNERDVEGEAAGALLVYRDVGQGVPDFLSQIYVPQA